MAVTAVLTAIDHVQEALPVQAPLQPTNVDPEAVVAVRVTGVPRAIVCAQAVPHEIPAGALVTVPAPVPVFVTVMAADDPAVPRTAHAARHGIAGHREVDVARKSSHGGRHKSHGDDLTRPGGQRERAP